MIPPTAFLRGVSQVEERLHLKNDKDFRRATRKASYIVVLHAVRAQLLETLIDLSRLIMISLTVRVFYPVNLHATGTHFPNVSRRRFSYRFRTGCLRRRR